MQFKLKWLEGRGTNSRENSRPLSRGKYSMSVVFLGPTSVSVRRNIFFFFVIVRQGNVHDALPSFFQGSFTPGPYTFINSLQQSAAEVSCMRLLKTTYPEETHNTNQNNQPADRGNSASPGRSAPANQTRAAQIPPMPWGQRKQRLYE